ncbi:MAG: hypothetical protein WCA43_11170 [Bradyrhizobium sp.]
MRSHTAVDASVSGALVLGELVLPAPAFIAAVFTAAQLYAVE